MTIIAASDSHESVNMMNAWGEYLKAGVLG